MRLTRTFGVLGLLVLGAPGMAHSQQAQRQAQGNQHLNQMIPLLEQKLPVLGIANAAYTAGRGGGGGRGGAAPATQPAAPPPPQPALDQVAKETVAYTLGDYEYNSYSQQSAQRFKEYMDAIVAAGGSMRTHPFISKVPIFHTDPAHSTALIHEQLGAGHVGIWMQQVETAAEVDQAVAAMRFTSKGGTRPENDVAFAARYWGLTEAQYREKADVWPLNPNGELVVFVIVESKVGIDNIREIAAHPAVQMISTGAGTLGGVFSTTNADGSRTRDQAAFDAGVAKILAACKEFNKVCGYPANNPAQIEELMGKGYRLFTMQSRNQAAFDAVVTGRRLGGRPQTP
jgi:2-keto-3-deoxy-L-rhamnonate aldolase RhmA